MRAALKALRSAKPAWIVVAVPGAAQAQDLIGTAADEFVGRGQPRRFPEPRPVYQEFGDDHSDEEIRGLVARAAPEVRH